MIAGYIGCPQCRTVLFAIHAKEVQPHTGHFRNELLAVGDWKRRHDGTDHTHCGDCGTTLERVPEMEGVR